MPTLKPKRTFVYSSENMKNVLEAALADRCDTSRINMSQAIEGILFDELVPRGGGLAETAMKRIYQGSSSVREELFLLFQENAAGSSWNAKFDDLKLLVELAARQALGAMVVAGLSHRGDGARPEFHLKSCWETVCERLERTAGGDGAAAASAAIDAEVARGLLTKLEGEAVLAEAKVFFDVVLRNWDALGNFTYTYRSLADVVDLVDAWPEDAGSRDGLKACLKSIDDARE